MNVLFYEYRLRMANLCYSLYLKRTDNLFYGLISMSI